MRTEPPLKTDKATFAVEALPEGKIGVRTAACEDARVILKGQVLELRNMDGQIRIARKAREYDHRDPDPGQLDRRHHHGVTRFMSGETRFIPRRRPKP
jgi:hypothetical protein